MQIGLDSFVAAPVDAGGRAIDPARHLSELLEAITLADEVGLDVFGIGEHHRREFLDSAPTVILAAALGLPLMVAIIGGEPHRFRPLIDRYRWAGLRAGHSPEQLKVGVHSLGYVADSSTTAEDEFFPGYARSFTEIGRERGWPPMTRAHFDAQLGSTGALLVGDPETVAEKILRVNESLSGISRLTFQMSVADLPHAKLMRAIELLGTHVAPLVRAALASGIGQAPLSRKSDRAA